MATRHILTLNAGSSSIKFALFRLTTSAHECARGQIEGLGAHPRFTAEIEGAPVDVHDLPAGQPTDHAGAVDTILAFMTAHFADAHIAAVGHRIVHGGVNYAEPVVLDDAVVSDLEALIPFAPLHQPFNLAGIAAAQAAFPGAVQIGCFDTAFHRHHPWVNDTFALPRAYFDKGVRRYGFHGLSYNYVSHKLAETEPELAAGRVVIAHLGNGASMCALKDGRSVGSTMGFTALDGLPMGTRCGQLDPGVVLYLMEQEGLDIRQVTELLYRESGLKGLSGLSQDMRTLEASESPQAAAAIDYFVFRARRELGAMAAILGGLDALIFCGGIGEHSWRMRQRICEDSAWLGLTFDPTRNRAGDPIVSDPQSKVRILVIATNEEMTIVRGALGLLAR